VELTEMAEAIPQDIYHIQKKSSPIQWIGLQFDIDVDYLDITPELS